MTDSERLSAGMRASMAWDRLWKVILSVHHPRLAADAWRLVRDAVDRTRVDLTAQLYETVIAAARARDSRSLRLMLACRRYPSRVEKEERRFANLAKFWAGRTGGTPAADAALAWAYLRSVVAKFERRGLDTEPAWRLVRETLDAVHTDLVSTWALSTNEGTEAGDDRSSS